MTVRNVLLWFCGILAALALMAALASWIEKKWPNQEYDERQKLIQGRGYRFAGFVTVIVCLVGYAYLELDGTLPLGTSGVLIAVALIQLTAFHIYCLIKNVALPLGNKGWLTVAGYALISVANLLNFRNQVKYIEAYQAYVKLEPNTTLPAAEMGDGVWAFLFLGITGGVLALMHLIRLVWPEEE